MKLGILGTGMIVKDVLTMYHELGVEKTYLFSTKKSKSQALELIEKYHLDKVYTDYDELLQSDVDTIYCALPNHLHYEFSKKALENGKNVIIEKPITANSKELEDLIETANKKNLMIFEGHDVEVFEFEGQVLFNPKHVAEILGIKNVNDNISRMNEKQVVKLTNSKVNKVDFRKLHNTGENFLTESGVYKLVFKSHKPNAEAFTDWIADEVLPTLRKTGSYEMPKKDKQKKEKLPSVNMMVKNIKEALHDAGVDSKYIAAEVVRIYSDSGYPVNAPVISDVPKLWDCTSIAKELGILSASGRPHDKAVSAIIQKLDIFSDEVVRTAYSRNGHDGVTVQYKSSVLEKVREWLNENGYPTVIELVLSNGNSNKCKVVYGEVA